MSATITFDTGAASLTMVANRYPDEPGLSYPMPSQQTLGGRVLAVDLGSGSWWENPRLALRRLTNTERTTLRDYIKDDLVYKTNRFTFVDGYGVTHLNMYFDGIESEARNKEGWDIVLRILKDMSL